MKKVLIFAPYGVEPMELVCAADILRRAGANVQIAAVGVKGLEVDGGHGVKFIADVMFDAVKSETFDMVVVPGGMGGEHNLGTNKEAVEFIRRHNSEGKLIGGICAAVGFVLGEGCKILKDKNACGYPGLDMGISESGGHIKTTPVTRDGNIITSRGPGTSILFGLTLVEALFSKEKSDEVAKGAIYNQ